MRKIIQLGESIRLYLNYTDLDTGAALDPAILTCDVRYPDGTIVTITHPSTDFVRLELGGYFVRINPIQIGTHYYSITAKITTEDDEVRNGMFDVEPAL